MKTVKNITAILFFGLLALLIGTAAGFNPIASTLVGFGIALIPKGLPINAFGVAGLEVEIWKDWIVEPLVPQNPWLDKCRNADEFVQEGKYVIIPQAGAASRIEKNRESLPATIKKKQDTHIFYGLDEFTSDPVLISEIEKVQLSYNKMETHMGIDRRAMNTNMAENILYKWAADIASGNVVPTSGAAVSSHLSGTTGTQRKKFTLDDLSNMGDLFISQDLDPEGWMMALDATMYKQLIAELKASDYRDFSTSFDKSTGKIIGKLFNFEIVQRSRLLRINGTTILDPYSFAAAADDNAIGVAWHPQWVERAFGEVKVFEEQGKVDYYGDAYSMLARCGGRRISKDDIGVGLISQAAV